MADAESSRITRHQTCVLTEATRELAAAAVRIPVCSSCQLPITVTSPPPYQDCSSIAIPVSYRPFNIAISPDSLTAWATNEDEDDNSVGRIDQITNTEITTIDLGENPVGIAIDHTNTYVWVTTYNGVFRIEVATNDFIGPIAAGDYPLGIAVSPDDSTVWMAIFNDNSVVYLDPVTNVVSAPILVGTQPTKLVVTPTTVYVVNSGSNTVSCISTSTYAVINTYAVGNGPRDLALSPDNSILWIINYTDNTISVLNSSTGVSLTTIPLLKPNRLAISPDYSSVWVTQSELDTVTCINALTYATITTIPVGYYPLGIAINPDNSALLVSNSNIQTVTKLYTPGPPPNFRLEGFPVPNGGTGFLTLTIQHGRTVDLTSYVQAVNGSTLTFTLPTNLGGTVEINGSNLTAYQTTPYLPITVTSASSCTQEPGSMILNIILTVPSFTTPSESNYLLSKVTRCPLFILNPIQANRCQFTVAPSQGSFTPPSPSPSPSPSSSGDPYPYVSTPPDALYQYRTVPRIRGIDQIATVVRGQSAAEATFRKQVAVLRGHAGSANPFFRKSLPLPPCVTRLVPQPPYQPAPPCRPIKY